MASSSSSLCVEHLNCSICQDAFNDPVTTPCGHNFCIKCITEYWDNSLGCQCPLCKKNFHLRPELGINREFRWIIGQVKMEECPIEPGEVPCDACVKIKRGALKSCLHCRGTFCKTHLEPHNTVAQLKKHKLIKPVENLEDYICQKHASPLELFCRDDQISLCLSCVDEEHTSHNIVPVETESKERKSVLQLEKANVHVKIQERTKKTEMIKQSVQLSRMITEGKKADCVELFATLIRSIESCQSELLDIMEKKQIETEYRAEDLIKELEQEIAELKKRDNELVQLSNTEDHFQFLKIYPSRSSPLNGKNWSEVSIKTHLSVNTVRKALTKHQEDLNHTIMNVTNTELRNIERFAVNVTLDRQTAHRKLYLSEDDRQAVYGQPQDVLKNPKRFDICPSVMGKEKFSSGRFYFVVQVKGKTEWDLGVASESVNTKGTITLSPGKRLWTLILRNGSEYKACDIFSVPLSLRVKPQKVGVFVDYEEGLVSFYDVESRSHIYSFTGQSFTENLCPYFSPGLNNEDKNSAPLIISANQEP